MAKQVPNLSGAQATAEPSRRAPALFDQMTTEFFPDLTQIAPDLAPDLDHMAQKFRGFR